MCSTEWKQLICTLRAIYKTVGKHLRMTESENNSKGFFYNEISKIANINPRFHRISSMLLDHVIMTFIIIPPMVLYVILGVNEFFNIQDPFQSILFYCLLFIYLNKDFFNAKSPAKRILGYQVIKEESGQPATELQCFIRNLTILVAWPLEVLISFLNTEKRIGDYIANTKVVVSEKEKLKTIWRDLKNKKLQLNFIAILIIGVVYLYGVSLLFQG